MKFSEIVYNLNKPGFHLHKKPAIMLNTVKTRLSTPLNKHPLE